MRWRTTYGLLAALSGLLAGGAWMVAGPHTPVSVPPIYSRHTTFNIPFDWEGTVVAGQYPVAAQLHVSADQGRTWHLHQRATVDSGAFSFSAKSDGEYWFVVRTVDQNGRFWPDDSPPRQPEMVVVVDSTAPKFTLTAARGSNPRETVVRWNAADPLLVPSTLRVEYAVQGADNAWHPVNIAPWQVTAGENHTAGETILHVSSSDALRVRALIEDRAGNVATAEAEVPAGAGIDPIVQVIDRGPADTSPLPAPRSAAANNPPLLVNSLAFELDYDVASVGGAGISRVEVWGTRDGGRNWTLLGTDDDCISPCSIQVDHPGLYGFTIVVERVGGVRGAAPAPGDAPDIYVGVDLEAPVARLTTAEPAATEYGAGLKLKWLASDHNLAADGISLYYAPRNTGPWLPLAKGLENTGEHICSLEGHAVDQMYLRLEVRDQAGNVTVFDTTQPIHVGAIREMAARNRQRDPVESAATSHWYHVLR